jgi:hypothetical protein
MAAGDDTTCAKFIPSGLWFSVQVRLMTEATMTVIPTGSSVSAITDLSLARKLRAIVVPPAHTIG